jgi:lipopolysaccharide biosynthesis regulator YciM
LPAAVALGKRMFQKEPLFYPARMTFGNLLLTQGDTPASIREEEKVLEQASDGIAGTYFLALAYFDAGELGKARKILETARSRHAENYWVRIVWALLLALEGKKGDAIREMDGEVQRPAPDRCNQRLP